MAIGISGDVQAELGAQNPLPATTTSALELRVISRLLQNLLGSTQATDDLDQMRADEAFAMSVATPLPGNAR